MANPRPRTPEDRPMSRHCHLRFRGHALDCRAMNTTLLDADATPLPVIGVSGQGAKRLRSGHPWVFSNDVRMDAEARALAPGVLVQIKDTSDRPLGVASFNPRSLISARLLARGAKARVDRGFLGQRLASAQALRARLYDRPDYRLVHSEGDGLPGLVIDHYGEVIVVQPNTAGMERLLGVVLALVDELLAPKAVVIRADSPVRALEGLDSYVKVTKGDLDEPVELAEAGVRFQADLLAGQKTGWFFDQRPARDAIAGLAEGKRVLDLYCNSGAFALRAAAAGAAEVLGIDRSEHALGLARQSAALNGLATRCRFEPSDAFAELTRLQREKVRFEVVIADPPAFVKSRKKLFSGLRGYFKLARDAARLVRPSGFLSISSCSHHVSAEAFAEQVRHGVWTADRTGRVLRALGAGPDHPAHLHLPETRYLTTLLMQLD